MKIANLLKSETPSISFEFFPPKTEQAAEALFSTIQELETCSPSFVSVTYGAGGSTRSLTHDLVKRIIKETSIPAIPHLTCVGHSRQEISDILTKYEEVGVNTILALRGDPPQNQAHHDRSQDDFQYSNDLVQFINQHSRRDSQTFETGVAGFPEGHPETPNRMKEMDFLKAKIDAGADYICTQLFFDNHDFFDFRERCELAGINVPILAGIMPITSITGMKRMAELAAGARYPAKLIKAMNLADPDNPAEVIQAGIDYATSQCQELIDAQVSGLHFFTLNKSQATTEIFKQLRL